MTWKGPLILPQILLVGTQLMSLAEEDLAFEGLEESLEEFRVKEGQYATEWTWSHLRDLQKLQTIDIEWVSLGSISDPMPHLPSLTGFAITRADISFIVDKAFQKLENVVFMVLKNNGITAMTRSMLPDPANYLISLDLSYNKLQSLPGDMFDNMPSLDDLNLENNLFTTLTEGPFSQAFVQVSSLSLEDNNIRCDCRLRWMVNIRMPNNFIGAVCAQPQSLRGRSLNSITMRELYC